MNGNHETHLGLPDGIVIHRHTKMIYVNDTKHHHVQILYPNLNYFNSFSCYGKGSGLLNQPKDVAFDSMEKCMLLTMKITEFKSFQKLGSIKESLEGCHGQRRR